jgi:hypothetical protein
MYTSNFCVGYPSDTNLGVHVWANWVDGASFSSNGGGSSNQGGLASWWGLSFRCLADNTERHLFDCRTRDTKFKGALTNTGDASFSFNASVGLGITTNSLTVNNMFVNNTISALARISSGGDIISSSAGGNSIGTSGSPWGASEKSWSAVHKLGAAAGSSKLMGGTWYRPYLTQMPGGAGRMPGFFPVSGIILPDILSGT